MRTPTRSAAVCAALAVATIGFTGQASASPGRSDTVATRAASAHVVPATVQYLACTVTGSTGGATVSGWDNGPDDKLTIEMNVYDTAADGHNAAIRFKTQGYNGVWHYYAWHHDNAGNGTSLFVNTTAQDTTNGIFGIGIQIATMEGSSTIIRSCEDHWLAG